jgi:hypothetical protein
MSYEAREEAIAALEHDEELAGDLGDATATDADDTGVADHIGHK